MAEKSDLLNQLKIDRTAEPEKNGTSWIVLIAVAAVSIALGGFGALEFFAPMAVEAATDTIKTAKRTATTPTTGSESISSTATVAAVREIAPDNKILNASGYITARRIATVSAQLTGLITEVNVEEGMAVKKGQVLAKLDDAVASVNLRFAQAQIKANEARLGRIIASLAEAKRVLARVSKLSDADFSSKASLTRAQADVEGLTADLASAKADIAVSKVEAQRQRERLDDHTIRAPFDGIVTVKNAQPGKIISPGSAGGGFTRTGICTIVDMTSLEIEVDVNEAFIGRVFAGQKVEANLDAYPSWDIKASVIAIIPTADRAKATVRVRIRIEENDSRILPDMGVKVAFFKA